MDLFVLVLEKIEISDSSKYYFLLKLLVDSTFCLYGVGVGQETNLHLK